MGPLRGAAPSQEKMRMLRRHEIGRRLEGLERAKAAEDDMPLYLLNYGGD